MENIKDGLFEFLEGSKTAYHAVENISDALDAAGYTELSETEAWSLTKGGKYYVVRDGSSIIAFRNMGGAFMISASHSDSPAFRVKNIAESAPYIKLDVEKYGGLINYTWLDRPLTVAGRVAVRSESGIEIKLADIGDKRVVIPSLAIHLNRTVNDSCKLSPTSDLIPLASIKGGADVICAVAESIDKAPGDIVSYELILTSADKPVSVGLCDELVLSPRIDDLGAVYASLCGFLSSSDTIGVTPVLAVFDNEEVGSETKQGAASTFLYDTLMRICGNECDYLTRVAASFMLSADNAHAKHPSHPELSDPRNAPVLGAGVVVKHNANQRYTTDAVSEAVFLSIAKAAGVGVQHYYNRADLPGGSTLGSIANTKVPVSTVDIGVPQLAMHSANETCALCDVEDMAKIMEVFYNTVISKGKDEIKIITK